MPRINKYSALMFTLLIYMLSPISAKRIEAMLDKFKVQRNSAQSDDQFALCRRKNKYNRGCLS